MILASFYLRSQSTKMFTRALNTDFASCIRYLSKMKKIKKSEKS